MIVGYSHIRLQSAASSQVCRNMYRVETTVEYSFVNQLLLDALWIPHYPCADRIQIHTHTNYCTTLNFLRVFNFANFINFQPFAKIFQQKFLTCDHSYMYICVRHVRCVCTNFSTKSLKIAIPENFALYGIYVHIQTPTSSLLRVNMYHHLSSHTCLYSSLSISHFCLSNCSSSLALLSSSSTSLFPSSRSTIASSLLLHS